MEKGRFRKFLIGSGVVLSVILIAITYFFVLNNYTQVFGFLGSIVGLAMPFIIGAVIAYLLKPICNFFERIFLKIFSKAYARNPKKIQRIVNPIAILISYVLAIAAIAFLLFIAGWGVYNSFLEFTKNLPDYINNVLGFFNGIISSNGAIKDLIGQDIADKLVALEQLPAENKLLETGKLLSDIANDPRIAEMFKELTSNPENGLDVGAVFLGTSNVISSIIDFGIGVVVSFFLLLNRKIIAKKSVMFLHVIFKKDIIVDAIVEEAKFADKTFGGYIEGKIIGSTIVGLVYYLFLTLCGIPHAALIAVICGATNIIPIFGPFIGSIPSGVIILLASNPDYGFLYLIIFVIFVCVYQFIDGYIIDPNIVGGNIKLAPVWVIFAVIFFGGLWGFPGLLIGVPLFAVIYDIIGKACAYMLKKNGKHHLLIEFKQQFSEPDTKIRKRKKKKEMAAKEAAQAVDVQTEASPDPDTSSQDI